MTNTFIIRKIVTTNKGIAIICGGFFMNNKTKTRSLRVAIIAIALLLCFALAVGVTSALYQARRQATGTLNMDKGIVIDYKGFNKGDENI